MCVKIRPITSVVVVMMFAGCTASTSERPSKSKASLGLTFAVEKDAAGQRILYPSRGGVIDRLHPVRTSPTDWDSTNHQEPVVCESTHYVEHITKQEICVMWCSDGSHYKIPCGADIFANGFDHEQVE
jgi:hypothetical protein